jgi:aspartate kinase
MVQALGAGKIVIVAGFQGVDANYNITTLGRGGSDTTAVALAAVLGADGCEIYTDVDGVYTTDPRIVPESRKIDRISYDEMLELASLGAGVMHSRSIEFAKKYSVPIHVRSSFSDAPGTWIVGEADARRLGAAVTGAALAKDEARITILGVPDRPGVVHAIFQRIAAAKIVVDMIVQNVATGGTTEVSFTVAKGDLPETLRAAESAGREIGALGVTHDADVAKISVVGLGMRTHTGVATTMFEALAAAGINIQMITTSEIKITVLLDRASAAAALRVVHSAFLLDQLNSSPKLFAPTRSGAGPMELVPLAELDTDGSEPQPRGMEDLVIAGVELDESQARVALFHVPDRPGYAARVFRAIADAGVFVDMIVQNVGIAGDSVLSFTVPADAASRAVQAVNAAGVPEVSVEPAMAKISVIGVGMRTHTGVANRMFAALAERGININLINTSEVRINVGTDVARGREGLECLKHAFAL